MTRDDVSRGTAVRVGMGLLAVAALGCRADEDAGELLHAPLAQAAPQSPTSLGLPPLSREQLQDPQTCAGCHPAHFRQWQQSMHAYAADDPVFLAMNRRGQRETNGELGDFCVRCHAPMAVRAGLTKDGLNLDEVPRKFKGVTCYFCHNAVDVGPEHFNNPIVLANDTTMRGGIRDPVKPGVHEVAFDLRFERNSAESARMCGACHDIVNPKGTHIERTFEEYRGSYFNIVEGRPGGDSCQGCHMPAKNRVKVQVATVGSVPLPKRDFHQHTWPAVDVALSDWPDDAEFRRRTECELTNTGMQVLKVTHDGRGGFLVLVESGAGHRQPSGAAQDRRLWLEATAYDAQGRVLLKTGVVADGEVEEFPLGHPRYDRWLTSRNMMRDRMFDEAGHETHDFWRAVGPAAQTTVPISMDPKLPHYRELQFSTPAFQVPARVEMRLRMRPVGMDVLADLVASGDLDPAVPARMPTFTLRQSELVWTPEQGNEWQPRIARPPLDCKFDDPGSTTAPAVP